MNITFSAHFLRLENFFHLDEKFFPSVRKCFFIYMKIIFQPAEICHNTILINVHV